MSLAFKLAFRNLFHDRLRLIATVIGIVFSIVLVTVQMGLYLGFGRMVTVMIDHAGADLWIMPRGTKCFEDPSLLDARERIRALSVAGVAAAIPVVIGFADWRTPTGASTPVFVVGSDLRGGGLQPWNVVEGRVEVAFHPRRRRGRPLLFRPSGTTRVGEYAEIRHQSVQVAGGHQRHPLVHHHALCVHGSTAPAPTPARRQQGHLFPGPRWRRAPTCARCATTCARQLADVEVLTPAEFRERSANFWLFGTGAGAALFAGALLGVIVGTVIVAQTLYSSTKDHLNEFATLRAIGSSRRYIYKVIIFQALLSARDRLLPRRIDRLDRRAWPPPTPRCRSSSRPLMRRRCSCSPW